MDGISTELLDASDDAVARAAQLLRAGGLVAFPTETVYGLGADATSGTAVARIFEAKGRPRFNPLIVHVADLAAADVLGVVEGAARLLADAFWPGPLTLVVPLREPGAVHGLVTAGLGTVGLRVPASPVAQRLLRAADRPLAAPSANPSGRVSPTTADHVVDGLGGRIDAILDGGACEVGLESTIVGFSEGPTLLRPGGVAQEAIETVLGLPLEQWGEGRAISAPGQLTSHYAPSKPIRLNSRAPVEGELWLGFGPGPVHPGLNLSRKGDLREAAAALFGHLRALDKMEGRGIAVGMIPQTGLGQAINDRLKRAAAPRS